MRRINKIIIHCSATPEGREVNAETIDRWHKERGFNMIGYHYVIGLNGQIEEGRPEKMVGAHCKGHNGESIGICYIGGMDKDNKEPKDTRTREQRNTLKLLIAEIQTRYLLAQGYKPTVHGHKEFSNKACPSFEVSNEFKN